jgi:hypothetical protein
MITMHSSGRKALAAFGVALTLWLASAGLSRADGGHKHEHHYDSY